MDVFDKKSVLIKKNRNFRDKVFTRFAILFVFAIAASSCSKDDSIETPPNDITDLIVGAGVTEDDFEKFSGELGAIINARNIAKKGYRPTQAVVTINTENGDFSQTIALEDVSFMGQLKIPIENLDEAALNELSLGVPISVDIKDDNSNTLLTQELSAVVFRSNPEPVEFNVSNLEETEENLSLNLRENTPYYIQYVSSNGEPTNFAMVAGGNIYQNMFVSSSASFNGVEEDPKFVMNFIPIPDEYNTFAIKTQAENRLIGLNAANINGETFVFPYLSHFTSLNAIENSGLIYKFTITKEEAGVYIISPKGYEAYGLKDRPGIGLIVPIFGSPNDLDVRWRIISNSLDWSVEDVGISSLSPILAEPSTDFGANSTLTNCANGELTQTIGIDQTISISNTVGWEERFSLTGSTSTSITAGVSAEFEAGFFGNTATYNASLSTTIEASVSITDESSEFSETEETIEETIFFERTVTVPPGSATLVYDVAQIYDDTKIQFVKRLRLRATESGNALSGNELKSQLQFSRFSGVVQQIGSDFIDITIKGTTTLGKVLQTQTTAQDVPAACN